MINERGSTRRSPCEPGSVSWRLVTTFVVMSCGRVP
jgi:hypothetical protein